MAEYYNIIFLSQNCSVLETIKESILIQEINENKSRIKLNMKIEKKIELEENLIEIEENSEKNGLIKKLTQENFTLENNLYDLFIEFKFILNFNIYKYITIYI